MAAGDEVRQVKERLDIVEIVSAYVRLQRAGREFTGLCPFHSEKSPSFTVNREKQLWYCHGCSQGGDLIEFVQKVEGTDFRQTLEALAEKAGVTLEGTGGGRRRTQERQSAREANRLAAQYYHYVMLNMASGGQGLRYLSQRGVEDQTIEAFQIGFAPASMAADNLVRFLKKKGIAPEEAVRAGLALGGEGRPVIDRFRGRLMIPITDESGQVVGFGGRAMDSTPPKYMNSPTTSIYDKSRTIYGLSHARKAITDSTVALLMEGYFDVIMAHQTGITNAVASSGTALGEEQVRILRRFATDLLLCLDSDEAGKTATERAIDIASRAGMRVRVVELPNAKDPGDFFLKTPQLWGEAEGAALAGWEWWLDRVLKGFKLRRSEERAAAAEACIPVLSKITQDATLDIYCQYVAQRLGLPDPAVLLAGVQRVRAGGSVRTSHEPAVAVAAGTAVTHLADEEERLLSLILGEPQALPMLRELTGDEPLGSPEFQQLCERLGELPEPGGTLERQLEAFTPEERERLIRLSFAGGVGAEESQLRAAIADCVDRIRLKAYKAAMAAMEDKLRAELPGQGDSNELLQEFQRVARRYNALRTRLYQGQT
jgi:DNA primase